jgi:hypothetical protein
MAGAPTWVFAGRVERDPLARERDLHLFARLVDPPLHGGERDLEGIADLRIREADDVPEEESHFQVRVESRNGSPDRIDRLDAFERRVRVVERGQVLDRARRLRLSLPRAELVQDAVLGDLEEPGRKTAAQREPWKPLVDPKEDVLRQILGQRAVVDHPQDVVVDRQLVRPMDDRESAFVTPLRRAENREIGLLERH